MPGVGGPVKRDDVLMGVMIFITVSLCMLIIYSSR
jgi:hypothetical protein